MNRINQKKKQDPLKATQGNNADTLNPNSLISKFSKNSQKSEEDEAELFTIENNQDAEDTSNYEDNNEV